MDNNHSMWQSTYSTKRNLYSALCLHILLDRLLNIGFFAFFHNLYKYRTFGIINRMMWWQSSFKSLAPQYITIKIGLNGFATLIPLGIDCFAKTNLSYAACLLSFLPPSFPSVFSSYSSPGPSAFFPFSVGDIFRNTKQN